MSDITVSVCCLAYNHQSFIRECLDGFVMQKCNFNFEVLINDDASTDNTAKIIKEYEAKYPEIIKPIYQTENQYSKGIKPTLSFNFPRAKGKYIALCEGDDYWTDPLKLQKQVDFLEANEECSFCFHKTYRKEESATDCQNLLSYPLGLTKMILNASEYLNIVTTATCSLMFRNIALKVFKVLEHSQGDFILYCELLHHGKAGFIGDIMSVYRKHEKGVSYNNSSEQYLYNRIIELKKEQLFFNKSSVKKEIGRIYKIHIKKYLKFYKSTTSLNKIFYLQKELFLNKSNQIEFYQLHLRKVKAKFNRIFNLVKF